MDGFELIATARVPEGVELRLLRCGDEFSIALERTELMSTRVSASEQALATITCSRLGRRRSADLLIGGYGMGFTLRAALSILDQDANVTVAELVPEIIQWARGPMHEVTSGCLDDARVTLVDDDVVMLINAADGGYDAILLDVDNGPHGLTRRANDQLYSAEGLQAAMTALKADGILAIWSAERDASFTQRLKDVGFTVDELDVQDGCALDGDSHVLWFAQRGGSSDTAANTCAVPIGQG